MVISNSGLWGRDQLSRAAWTQKLSTYRVFLDILGRSTSDRLELRNASKPHLFLHPNDIIKGLWFIAYETSFKDTSTIPFLAENYSELVKYSDKINWKYFWSIPVPMTSSVKIFILTPGDQRGDFFESRLVFKWSASYKLQNDV